MNALANLRNAAKTFHSDESGLQTLDVVMIVAVAAVVLLIIVKFGKTIFHAVQDRVQLLIQ